MGYQHISIGRSQPRRGRARFRNLFVWYFFGVLTTTFLVSCILEGIALYEVAMNVQHTRLFTNNLPLQILVVLGLIALPCFILIISILFFAWRMGRRISQPVDELMLAVEKIRQHDLNFSINYNGRDELGDLCSAFNELRRELQESLEREWRKQEEMRTMIAALSHDLRTPVTIIQGHVEGLARAEAGEKRNQRLDRYLPVLEASSQRMTRLLNDMLLVSSLEQAGFIIQPQPVQLDREMERKVEVYKLQASVHEINFSYTYQNLAGQEYPVALDLHHIEQVLDNLFENALRFTPDRGKINLTCTRQDRYLSFVLRDTGRGLAPADLPRVFEKFYQGSPRPGEKARKAAGLGLYTCKLLIEKHGGTIAIQNGPMGGCEVAFCLPAAPVAVAQGQR